MCVIAVCNEGNRLDKETFEKCFDANSHGVGIAWINEKLFYAKGLMEEKQAWKVYDKVSRYPHVVHFRLTSSGGTCPELTHPFIIEPTSPIKMNHNGGDLLFHNGTVSDWKNLYYTLMATGKHRATGKMSDTRVMAMAVSIMGDSVLEIDGGKYVIANKDNFVMYGGFEEKDGIYYSNLHWDWNFGKYRRYSNDGFMKGWMS